MSERRSLFRKALNAMVLGLVVGGLLGFAAPPTPLTATEGCKCVMPDLGSYRCTSPSSSYCSGGPWACTVTCTD